MNRLVFLTSLCGVVFAYTVEETYYPPEVGYGYEGPEYVPKYIESPRFRSGIGQIHGKYVGEVPYISGGYGGYAAPIGAGYARPIVGGYNYPLGGQYEDRNLYKHGKENFNDGVYEKAHGRAGGEIGHGQNGYNENQFALKEGKGDSEYYSDVEGGKEVIGDGKQYSGGKFYDQGGKNGREEKQKQGHKKGHIVKGFKHSHHKDESGKTEEYYDEADDEGGHFNFDGQSGQFKENKAESFKGGHDDEKYGERLHKNGGHYVNDHFVDKNVADHGKFGENKYATNGNVYGRHKGVDQESLLGSQEYNKYYKHSPYVDYFYRQ